MEFVLEELKQQVLTARAAQRALRLRGGGTKDFYGEPFEPRREAAVLDLSVYTGIVSYEPSELVITARAGTPLAEIEAALDGHRQMLACEPPRYGAASTIGGCVAAGLSGPRRLAAGSVRDFVLGAHLLDAGGQVLQFGGQVMKNVAGYDVSRLLAGSLGVLGAILQVSLKVAPRPLREQTLRLPVDEAGALRLCGDWRGRPLPISATAWLQEAGQGVLHARLSGSEPAVESARRQIGGEPMAPAAADAFWAGLRDQTLAFFQAPTLWRVALPMEAPPLALGDTLAEWHGTQRWLAAPHDPEALRRQVQALGGHATLYRRGPGQAAAPFFHPLSPGLLAIHRRLKQALDPAGLFNPQRLSPDL